MYRELWQCFAILPVNRSVGVQGDERTYGAHRGARRHQPGRDDGRPARLPYDLLETLATRIINEVPEVNRVVYDVRSKPPSTIGFLRRAVPPRGGAHATRQAPPAQLPLPGLRLRGDWTPESSSRNQSADPRAGRRRQGDPRPLRRRRLLRGGHARAQGHRRPAHLHLRRQRPHALREADRVVETFGHVRHHAHPR